MNEVLALLRKDQFAARCGITIDEVRPGFARCSMPITNDHLNGLGSVMGGAVFTLADFAFGAAANSHGTLAVSLQVSISYLRPCSEGILTATAEEISRSKRTGVYRVTVVNKQQQPVAEVTGTCYFKIS
jgi:acyl-CoA thioesterase